MNELNVTSKQLDAIADRLQYEKATGTWDDYSELCYAVALDMDVDTKDVERIYDDLFVNAEPQWVGSDYYGDEDEDEDDEDLCY